MGDPVCCIRCRKNYKIVDFENHRRFGKERKVHTDAKIRLNDELGDLYLDMRECCAESSDMNLLECQKCNLKIPGGCIACIDELKTVEELIKEVDDRRIAYLSNFKKCCRVYIITSTGDQSINDLIANSIGMKNLGIE